MRVIIAVLLVGVAMAEDFDKLWDFQKPAETEEKFRELLPQAPDKDYELQLKTQIARSLGLQGKFDDAHAVLDGVEKELTDELNTVRMRYLLERGRTFNSSGKKDEAKKLFLAAWDHGNEHGEEYFAVDAAHMMAFVEPPEQQLVWTKKALELAERSTDPRAKEWLGSLYNNIGWAYHDLGEYEKARAALQKGWDWNKERDPDGRGARIAKWAVAKQLRMLKRTDEALEMLRELAAVYAKLQEKDGFVQEEIGECLLLLGRADEATPHFQNAYAILKDIEWIEAERLARLKKLAK